MNILITGAKEFLGYNLVLYWRKVHPGDTVYCMDDARQQTPWPSSFSGENTILLEGDLHDRFYYERVFQRYSFDAAINASAVSRVHLANVQVEENFERSLQAFFYLADSCRQHGVRLLQLSRGDLYQKRTGLLNEKSPVWPQGHLGAAVLATELFLQSFCRYNGLEGSILRLPRVYGPNEPRENPFVKMVLSVVAPMDESALPQHFYCRGQEKNCWVYALDMARAADLVLQRGKNGEIYQLGGQMFSNDEIARQLLRQGRREDLAFSLEENGTKPPAARELSEEKLEKKLGYQQQILLEEGLRYTLDWYRENQPCRR